MRGYILYRGNKHGKTVEQARYLAELTREFTDVVITVESLELEELREENRKLHSRILELERRLLGSFEEGHLQRQTHDEVTVTFK